MLELVFVHQNFVTRKGAVLIGKRGHHHRLEKLVQAILGNVLHDADRLIQFPRILGVRVASGRRRRRRIPSSGSHRIAVRVSDEDVIAFLVGFPDYRAIVLETYFLVRIRIGLAIVIRIGRPVQGDETVPGQRVEINLYVIRISNVALWDYRVVRHCRAQYYVARWRRQRSCCWHRGCVAVRPHESRTVPSGGADNAEGDNRDVFGETFQAIHLRVSQNGVGISASLIHLI